MVEQKNKHILEPWRRKTIALDTINAWHLNICWRYLVHVVGVIGPKAQHFLELKMHQISVNSNICCSIMRKQQHLVKIGLRNKFRENSGVFIKLFR